MSPARVAGHPGRNGKAAVVQKHCRRPSPGTRHLLSLVPVVSMRAARPASSLAVGIRNGEQET